MRKLVCLAIVAALLGGIPTSARAQNNFPVPPVDFTGPLSHPRYETGGFFVAIEGLFLRQNRPLQNEPIAFRGIVDGDGSITGQAPGTFAGSGQLALSTSQLRGPGTYQPGWDLTVGWLFENEVAIQANWKHLLEGRYAATATLAPRGALNNVGLIDTFLTAGVYNFPIEFAGNPQNVNAGNTGATFGIWNAATLMQEQFLQRFDIYEISGRFPLAQTDNHRYYGLAGPRIVWFWERFLWRTVDADLTGNSGPNTTADYTNVVSNRLYGVHFGVGHDWFLGDTPVGAFSWTMDCEGGLYIDFAKLRAKYERGDRAIAASRARNVWSFVPGAEVNLKLWWFPWEGVQMSVGYDFMAFFNTWSSPQPVDFNMGAIDPQYNSGTFRWLHGLQFGIAFVF